MSIPRHFGALVPVFARPTGGHILPDPGGSIPDQRGMPNGFTKETTAANMRRL